MQQRFLNRKYLSLFFAVLGVVFIILINFVAAGTAQHIVLSCLIFLSGILCYIVARVDVKERDK